MIVRTSVTTDGHLILLPKQYCTRCLSLCACWSDRCPHALTAISSSDGSWQQDCNTLGFYFYVRIILRQEGVKLSNSLQTRSALLFHEQPAPVYKLFRLGKAFFAWSPRVNLRSVNQLSIKYRVFCLQHRQKMKMAVSRLRSISKSNAGGQLKVNLTWE